MAVFNNGYLGMVRQRQQFFHEKRYSCTPLWSPDYVKLAEAYGIPGYRVKDASDLAEAVGHANTKPGPALVGFMIEEEAHGFPLTPPRSSLMGVRSVMVLATEDSTTEATRVARR